MIPETRSEQYLASIVGEDVGELPPPQSRIEHYLNAIAQNGIEPSSAGLITYDPDAAYPDGSIGEAVKNQALDKAQIEEKMAEVAGEWEETLDEGTIVAGSWYQNNGTVAAKTGYSRTDKLALNGAYAVKVNFTTENYRAHFFDSAKARINKVFSLVADQYFVCPSGAEYIGISADSTDMASIEITLLQRGAAYDAIDAKVSETQGVGNAGKLLYTNAGGVVGPHAFFSNSYEGYSANLFDRSRVTVGVDLTGAAKSGYASMDYFLPVYPGVKYCKSNTVAYQQYGYDEFFNVVTTTGVALDTTAKTLPDNVKYIRICWYWNEQAQREAGIFAGIDSFSGQIRMEYGENPNYYSVDAAFDRYLHSFGLLANRTPALAGDEGRYSGTEDIEQYSKLVHSTNGNLQIHDAAPGSPWAARGVKQYFSADYIEITKQTGSVGIYADPSDIGAEEGDTVYVGFLARTADGQAWSTILHNDAWDKWQTVRENVYFDGNIRAYEFSHVVEEGETSVRFCINDRSGLSFEFSNLYVRKATNLPYETLFIDPAREAVVKYILSENLKTKTLVAFGDSVTAAGKFLAAMKKRLPLGSLVNEGIGGSCFCYTDTTSASNFYNVVDTKQTDIESADIITVAYGTNDSNYIGKTTTIGAIAAPGSTFDLLTVYGAIQAGLEKIIGYNGSARIIMCIPATWIVHDYMDEIAKAIKDCAELYGCIVADLRQCGCNELTQDAMTADGLHPNDATGDLCGKILADAMGPIWML